MTASGQIARSTLLRWAHRRDGSGYAVLAALTLIGLTVFHLWYIGSGALDLAPDEAHYWEWSRRLDWSYYSKGPLVAYLIAASTRLGGHTEFFVRLPAVLLASGTGMLVYLLTLELFASPRAAFLAVLTVAALPLYAAGSILMTTDAPLIFCWTLAAYSLRKALSAERRRDAWWCLFALALGLGCLAKYTMLLFFPCLVAYLWSSPAVRPYLRRREAYVAVFGGCLFCLPMIVWNAQHGWVSLRHVTGLAGLSAGLSDGETHFSPYTFFLFLGSQLGVVSPVLFVALLAALLHSLRLGVREGRDVHWFLFLFSAPLLGFFLLWSVYEKVEANWAAPAYLTATIALAGWWDEHLRGARHDANARTWAAWIAVVLLPGFVIVGVGHFPTILPAVGVHLPARADPTSRLRGWKELGIAVGRLLDATKGEDIVLSSGSYQVTSELAFYVPGHPRVYNINLGRRMNQYDLWGNQDALNGRDLLFVAEGNWEVPASASEICNTARKVEGVHTASGGLPGRTFSIFRCEHYKGPTAQRRPTY